MKSCFSATLFGLGLVTSAFGLTVNTPIAEAKENARAQAHHFTGVEVSQHSLTLTAVGTDGAVIDRAVLSR